MANPCLLCAGRGYVLHPEETAKAKRIHVDAEVLVDCECAPVSPWIAVRLGSQVLGSIKPGMVSGDAATGDHARGQLVAAHSQSVGNSADHAPPAHPSGCPVTGGATHEEGT